ncbi:MAG: oligosaccharide flippase family protein [Candidatus Promineifilaceae bacterium]|nr:oligosaccharide flippase family protein [Candidatus Promineifilaceae bacterium]
MRRSITSKIHPRLRRFVADGLIVAGFLLLPLLLFGSVSLGAKTMVPADNLFQWQPWRSAAEGFGIAYPYNGLLSDLILQNYPWKQFIIDSLAQGEIPLWNPHILAGAPFLAAGQHSAYYPFSLIFLIAPLAKAYGWFTISQLWLAGVLAYLFGRVLNVRRSSAVVIGLVFQGCGFLVVSSAVFPMILAAAVWLPLELAAIERIIEKTTKPEGAGGTLPWALVGAVGLGLQILAGHIEITYYTLLVMALYAAWRLAAVALQWRRDRMGGRQRTSISAAARYAPLLRPAVWLLAMVALGLLLGAIQLIPFVEVGQANFREGAATLAEIRGWAFPRRRALTLLMPDFFGNPADHTYFDVFSLRSVPFTVNAAGQPNPHGPFSSSWGIKNYVEGGIYLGILPLILSALALWSVWRRRRQRRASVGFFTVLSLLSLAFIFGTPLYAILYYGLPGINQLHSPFRWVFPLSLAVAVLAGYGMDYVADKWEQQRTPWYRPATRGSWLWRRFSFGASPSFLAGVAGAALWAGIILVGGLLASRALYAELEPTVNAAFLSLERATDAFPDARAFYNYEFEQGFILALFLLGAGLVLRLSLSQRMFGGRSAWSALAAVLIAADLFIAGYGFHAAADQELLAYQPRLVDWLQQQEGVWRLTTFAPQGSKPLNANTPWLAGLYDVRGYDSLILKQYTRYMSAIEPQNELPFNRIQPIVNWESLNSPLLDLLGVRYIVSAAEIELPKLESVWEGEGLIVYENLAVTPRAYTLPVAGTLVVADPLAAMQTRDPRQYVIVAAEDWPGVGPAFSAAQSPEPATISAYGNVEVRVQATINEASWLVLTDTYFRGWDVFARPAGAPDSAEEELTLVRVNGNFRGVQLEPGQWEVRFRYSPLSFKVGGLASFMGGIIVLFTLAVWGWRRFYNPVGPLSDSGSIAKNSLAPMALNLFNRAIDFAFAAFYLRVLGPEDAGKYATAIIIAGWFEIVSNFGLNTLIIREVSRERDQASRYLLNTTVLRLGTAIMAAVPILIYLQGIRAAGNPLDLDTTMAILLIMVGMLFSGMGQGLAGLYYAYEQAEFPAAVTTVTTILKVGFGVSALLLGFGFVGLAAVSIIVNVITLVLLGASALRQFHLKGPWELDFGLQRHMLSASYPLMLNHLFAVIFFQVDVPLMRQFNGETTVGWYNSAYKWVNAFNVIPSFFTFALFPVITRQVQSSLADARRTFRLSLKLMLVVAFPLATLTTLLAPVMIGVLGGREFLPHGAVALQLMIWSIPIGWMNSVTNYVLIALGREKKLTTAFVAGLSFNLVLNLLLLPRYSYLAAAVITILSELMLLFFFAAFLRPAMPQVRWSRIVLRPLAITALMLVTVTVAAQVHLALAVAAAIPAFGLGLLLLPPFSRDERRILIALLPQTLSGRFALAKSGG